MTHRHALAAAVCALIGAAALGPAPGQAGDLVIHGRIGDVFGGIDTRDGFRRGHRHGYPHGHRHGRPFHDPFDPSVSEEEFKERLVRRFEYEKLFNGGTGAFPADQRRRALEGWPPPPEPRAHRHDHRRDRIYPGVLLPEGHYDRYDDGYFGGSYGGSYGGDSYDDGSYDGDGHDRLERESAAGRALPEESPREPAATQAVPRESAAIQAVPDARGPRFESALRPGAVPAVGQRLPQGKPHVALDREDYDLPELPPGQAYVRFEGAVLVIEAASRIVRRVVWPPTG